MAIGEPIPQGMVRLRCSECGVIGIFPEQESGQETEEHWDEAHKPSISFEYPPDRFIN